MVEGNEIVITRVFDAPQKLVFKAWTEPERMKRWCGPNGFTMPFCNIDLRPGGAIHFCMRSPDGQDIWCKGVYREVVEPERKFTLRHAVGSAPAADREGCQAGWSESLDRLAGYLAEA